MDAGRDGPYSALEVVPHHYVHQMDQQDIPPPPDFEKQVAPLGGKQAIPLEGKQVVPLEEKQVSLDDGKQHMVKHWRDHHVNFHRPSRKTRILLGGAVALIVIIALVLGLVFGLRHRRSGTTPVNNSLNSSAAAPAQPSASTSPPQRNIAALSFASESVNNTRVYFQDNVGQIMEAANSAKDTKWSINGTGIIGKNGSAIAAAVSRPGFPLAISVFYLDINNSVRETIYNPSAGTWTSAALPSQVYTAMANSSLTAMYNQCSRCANTTIIAFQDENGFVQIGNLTSGGWTLTQLSSTLDPELGTGLALQPFYLNGSEDQINLYHQTSDLNLSLSSWNPPSKNHQASWGLNAQIYNRIPSGSPIAAASSYSNVSTGFETWIEVLSVSNKGIEVNTWSGAINDWLEQYNNPSAMANSTGNGRSYGSVAVTAAGTAFGVVRQDGQVDRIESWQVQDDMVDWSLVGDVDIGGAWG